MGLEIRRVSLILSLDAFDKTWHKGLIPRLKQNGISCNLLRTLTNFLNGVALNEQYSSCAIVQEYPQILS